jgi:hypothetical protein
VHHKPSIPRWTRIQIRTQPPAYSPGANWAEPHSVFTATRAMISALSLSRARRSKTTPTRPRPPRRASGGVFRVCGGQLLGPSQ